MSHAQPPPSLWLDLVGTPSAVGMARLHSKEVLAGWDVGPDVIDIACLVVSELATNAVRHARRASGAVRADGTDRFAIGLAISSSTVTIAVWDQDPRPPVMKRADVDQIGGRGLGIIDEESRRWGYLPARYRPGKVVWAEVSLAAAHSADAPCNEPAVVCLEGPTDHLAVDPPGSDRRPGATMHFPADR